MRHLRWTCSEPPITSAFILIVTRSHLLKQLYLNIKHQWIEIVCTFSCNWIIFLFYSTKKIKIKEIKLKNIFKLKASLLLFSGTTAVDSMEYNICAIKITHKVIQIEICFVLIWFFLEQMIFLTFKINCLNS